MSDESDDAIMWLSHVQSGVRTGNVNAASIITTGRSACSRGKGRSTLPWRGEGGGGGGGEGEREGEGGRERGRGRGRARVGGRGRGKAREGERGREAGREGEKKGGRGGRERDVLFGLVMHFSLRCCTSERKSHYTYMYSNTQRH